MLFLSFLFLYFCFFPIFAFSSIPSLYWPNEKIESIVTNNKFYKEIHSIEKIEIKGKVNIKSQENYEVRLAGGRTNKEGRVEVLIGGIWGVICPDNWGLLEARVVCKQLNMGYGLNAHKSSRIGGLTMRKLASGIECDGEEEKLSDCHHHSFGKVTICKNHRGVAGVMCSDRLPDLIPNATMIQNSIYLQDQPMAHIQCAMEENCAAPEAFKLKSTERDWQYIKRRLLRFSAMTWNMGTAIFKPISKKETWEWHLCHRHYHSMKTFAEYDIIDMQGNRVAHGHKASFCLEDNYCMEGLDKRYACEGYGEQAISIGCADIYAHDIDCQWIDITEMPVGNYTFKMNVNPDYLIAELDYNNNAVYCDLIYPGSDVKALNCKLSKG